MVRAWFMDDDVESDQRLEHHQSPPAFVDLQQLFLITGVEYFKVRWSEKCLQCKEIFEILFINEIPIRKIKSLCDACRVHILSLKLQTTSEVSR